MAPQTPRQRQANAKFARQQEAKMGTFRPPKPDPESRRKQNLSQKFKSQSSVTRWTIYLLLFILVGGIGLELLRLFF